MADADAAPGMIGRIRAELAGIPFDPDRAVSVMAAVERARQVFERELAPFLDHAPAVTAGRELWQTLMEMTWAYRSRARLTPAECELLRHCEPAPELGPFELPSWLG